MVSVIIPVYNAENYIEKAIRSVLSQTYPDYEVIVVDDGSTDSTKEIVEKLARKYEKIRLIHTDNGGVSRARNIGMESAAGSFVTFLDADDMLCPDALEKMRECLISSGADICSASYVTNLDVHPKSAGQKVFWDSKQGLLGVLEDHPATYQVWAKLYRAEKIKQLRFPEGKRVHEDSFFVFECIISGMSMVIWDHVVYVAYATPNSASRCGFSEKVFDMVDLAEEKSQRIRRLYPEYSEKAKNIEIKTRMALLNNLKKNKGRQYRSHEKECIAFIKENKDQFVPATDFDKKWFFIIIHNLYDAYKFYYHCKSKKLGY